MSRITIGLTPSIKLVTLNLIGLLLLACSSQPQAPAGDDIRSYAQALSEQLMDSGEYVRGGQRVMVTTPAWLESDLNRSSLLALQLQENLMAELHSAHLHVVEFKLTDGVRVTTTGDFPLSRDYLELRELQPADYILAATVVEREDGVTINARLVEFRSQVVAATAEVTIPRALVNKLRSEQGVELVSR